MADLLKVYVLFEGGKKQPVTCPAIQHEGRVWLVPHWTEMPDKKATTPKYLIPLDLFQHQKGGPVGTDYMINVGIPTQLFDEEIPKELHSKFQIVVRPNILFSSNGNRIHP